MRNAKFLIFLLPLHQSKGTIAFVIPSPVEKRRRQSCKHFSQRLSLQSIKCCLCLGQKCTGFCCKGETRRAIKAPDLFIYWMAALPQHQSHFWEVTTVAQGSKRVQSSVATVIALLIILLVAVVVSAHLCRGLTKAHE